MVVSKIQLNDAEYFRQYLRMNSNISLCEYSPYLEFFWSVFSPIWAEYREIRVISTYSVQIQEKKTTKFLNMETFHAVYMMQNTFSTLLINKI